MLPGFSPSARWVEAHGWESQCAATHWKASTNVGWSGASTADGSARLISRLRLLGEARQSATSFAPNDTSNYPAQLYLDMPPCMGAACATLSNSGAGSFHWARHHPAQCGPDGVPSQHGMFSQRGCAPPSLARLLICRIITRLNMRHDEL